MGGKKRKIDDDNTKKRVDNYDPTLVYDRPLHAAPAPQAPSGANDDDEPMPVKIDLADLIMANARAKARADEETRLAKETQMKAEDLVHQFVDMRLAEMEAMTAKECEALTEPPVIDGARNMFDEAIQEPGDVRAAPTFS